MKSRFAAKGAARVEDIDFVGQAQSQTLGQSEVNMEQLNLFGVALTSQEESELAEE